MKKQKTPVLQTPDNSLCNAEWLRTGSNVRCTLPKGHVAEHVHKGYLWVSWISDAELEHQLHISLDSNPR